MESSARGLTTSEWEALMDIAISPPGWMSLQDEILHRLRQMGLVEATRDGAAALTWIGREFVELKRSGLLPLVCQRPVAAGRFA